MVTRRASFCFACNEHLGDQDALCPNCGATVFEYEETEVVDTPKRSMNLGEGGIQNASRSFRSTSQYLILYKWRGFFLTSMERKLNKASNDGWELVAVSPGIMFTAAYMKRSRDHRGSSAS